MHGHHHPFTDLTHPPIHPPTTFYPKRTIDQFSQFTGSFKERGARNSLLLLTEEERKRGVMAARCVRVCARAGCLSVCLLSRMPRLRLRKGPFLILIPTYQQTSAGNHALALSWHGSQLGIPVHVFMPVVAPLAKVDKCRRFGAERGHHGRAHWGGQGLRHEQPGLRGCVAHRSMY